MQLQIAWNMPIAFGILTTGDMQQALDRAGGAHGNKGDEAAATAIMMVKIQNDMEQSAENIDRQISRNIN
jgi:6,7-dimethyl-8-ribityllumazine synthase